MTMHCKTVEIRPARAKDLPALWQLAQDNGVYLPEPENDIWIAEKTPTIVGFIACAFAVDEMSILGLAVDKSGRRQGIATRLHQVAIHTLKPAVSFLEVRESNLSAQQLYKKLHYQYIGKRKNYYRIMTNHYEDALLMRLDVTRNLPKFNHTQVQDNY